MPKDTLAPVDESVILPPSVRRAAEAAEAIHKQAYAAPVDPNAPPAPPQPDPAVQNPPAQPDPPQPALQAQPQPEPQPQPDPPQPEPQPQPQATVDWEHRYHSMEGRYRQAATTIGSMQEQMTALGDELVRTQALITQPRQAPQSLQPTRLITDADRETYGQELIDTIQRAAREAVAPDLQNVTQQVQQTSQQVTRQQRQAVYQALADAVPNWREVNNNPRFKNWCALPDIYSGQVRSRLLNAALTAADAPRVISFFKGFVADEVATGQVLDPQPQPGAPQPAPRQAAVSLEALAAPGRQKPASGATVPGSADKPIFTRAQISKFYQDSREAGLGKGPYAGRDADRKADEAAIFAAQKEGRVRG